MLGRKIMFVFALWSWVVLVAARPLSQSGSAAPAQSLRDPNLRRARTPAELKEEMLKKSPGPRLDPQRLRNMTEQQRKDEVARVRRLREEAARKRQQARPKETAREQAERLAKSKAERERKRKAIKEIRAKWAREFLNEKYALVVTDEQWAVIKPKLQRIRDLRSSPRSSAGLGLTSSGSSQTGKGEAEGGGVPTWQWSARWLDLPLARRTEGQKIAGELIDLVADKNTTARQFQEKMAALRKVRSVEEAAKRKKEEPLPEAQQELRDMLTTRQEAALVLMGWL